MYISKSDYSINNLNSLVCVYFWMPCTFIRGYWDLFECSCNAESISLWPQGKHPRTSRQMLECSKYWHWGRYCLWCRPRSAHSHNGISHSSELESFEHRKWHNRGRKVRVSERISGCGVVAKKIYFIKSYSLNFYDFLIINFFLSAEKIKYRKLKEKNQNETCEIHFFYFFTTSRFNNSSILKKSLTYIIVSV